MRSIKQWFWIFGIVGFFVGMTLDIFYQWQIGFWSDTMPTNIYVVMCIAYVLCVICLIIGLYVDLIYKPKGETWKKQ